MLADGFGDKLVIVPNGRGGLDVYPERNFNELSDRVGRLPRLDPFRRAFQYQYLSKAQDVILDPQGRIQVPLDLRQSESLTKDALIIGMQERFEVWNSERFSHYERDKIGAPIEDVEAKLARKGRLGVEREGTHLPVLVDEVTFLLRPRHGGWVVDGTIGMGGHAERLLEAGGADTRLLGIDHDPEALARSARASRALRRPRDACGTAASATCGSTRGEAGVERAAAILLDLGLSSYQLEGSGRGFTFQKDEPLDMRFDPTPGPHRGRTPRPRLGRGAGEHPLRARRGAPRPAHRPAHRGAPCSGRRIRTTAELVEAVKAGVPRAAWSHRTHVATRTFQALRIAVNEEPRSAPGGAGRRRPSSSRAAAASGSSPSIRARTGRSSTPSVPCATAASRPSIPHRSPRRTTRPETIRGPGAPSFGCSSGWRPDVRTTTDEPERSRHAAAESAARRGVEMKTGSSHTVPLQLSLGLRPPSTADQQVARFHRESDRRRLRAMLAGAAAAGVLVALVLGLVGLRMQQVRLSYRLDALRSARTQAEEMNRRLRVEKASLQSLARIEVEARARFGMVAPTQQQVQLAREFVAGGAGTTAATERTAAAVARDQQRLSLA